AEETMWVAGAREGNSEVPPVRVGVETTNQVAGLVTRTVASGMAAPAGSVTVPYSPATLTCALHVPAARKSSPANIVARTAPTLPDFIRDSGLSSRSSFTK